MERLDGDHSALVTDGALRQGIPGEFFVVGAVVLLILAMRWFGEGHAEQPAAASEFLCTMAIAEKAVIADVMEALGQDMQKKTTDELIGGEGHDLRLVMMAIILPGETHVAVVMSRKRLLEMATRCV